MKVDEEVRRQLIENLKIWLKRLNRIVKSLVKDMEEAETVEEIMALKRELLLRYICLIPISASYCYFCIKHDLECNKCEYAKHHGICTYAESDYAKIIDKAKELELTVAELYYKGEKYGED